MFFHSIRLRLQLWHGLILVTVLAGFGFTAHQLDRANRLRRVDRELQQRVSVIAGTLRRRGPERLPFHRAESDQRRAERGPPDGPPGVVPPPPDFRLSARDSHLFESTGAGAFYYLLWRRDGILLSKSTSAPENVPRPGRAGGQNEVRLRGTRRELFHYTPPGECILAGRDIAGDLAELRRLAGWLVGAGGGVLVLGLAGGWWLATRAIRPLEDISATAAKIATGDLSQRISTDTDNELGRLASVLNCTFARLEAAFAQQARFTSDAAHELRTPLTVMLTQTQSALARERPASEYRETLEVCQRAVQRMRRLTESLLELARLDAGQEPMKRERFDLARVARESAELVRPLAVERDIEIQCDLPTVECCGDPERIGQVVTNLLTNAIRYNRKQGEVHLSVRAVDGDALLTVADSGQGISAENVPHVFERFYRADKARSRADGHTGLGLAICKAIVDAHGGKIEVSSQPGSGSIFTVRLPTEAG